MMHLSSRRSRCFALVLLLFSMPLFAGSDFRVVASIKPLHSLLAALMQGVGSPALLLEGQQIPYGYRLTEAQRRQLDKANLVVWVGPELEAFLVEPLRQERPDRHVVALLDDPRLKVLPDREDDDRRDPFFWLDSRNGLILIDDLTRILMQADPGRAHVYRRNRDKVFAQAAEMDRMLEYGYRGMKGGVVILYYDTQQYFEQAYALKTAMVLSPLPPRSIGAAELLQARELMRDGRVGCLLTERGLPAKDLELLTAGTDVRIGELDSLGVSLDPGPDLYNRLIRHNTDVIRTCVNAQRAILDAAAAPQVDELQPGERIGGRFMLTDHNGNLVTEENLLGHYSLLYFGYTFCPDICPTSLQTVSLALDQLGDLAQRVQPYFITIDPGRDTVAKMKSYVQYFNDRLIGLVGSKAMIEKMAKEYRVRYEKVVEEGGDPELYLMDHTASVYLIGPDGQFITKFAHGITPQAMAERLREYLQ